MENKKTYTAPQMEITVFEHADGTILVTSVTLTDTEA